jgi:hypothetical protein
VRRLRSSSRRLLLILEPASELVTQDGLNHIGPPVIMRNFMDRTEMTVVSYGKLFGILHAANTDRS